VNPLEVEGALREHPGVQDCAVSPLPLSDTVLRLQASLVAAEGAAEIPAAELRAFLRERLAPAKIPRVFNWVSALPRSPLGKLQRDRLPGEGC
jgi:acyl-coenzyme A synthetase/AMP-(fatty) acid ligase